MNSFKWQRRYIVALVALAILWTVSAAGSWFLASYWQLQSEGSQNALHVAILQYRVVIDSLGAILSVITVVLRLRGHRIASWFSTLINVFFVFKPVLGTILGIVGLTKVRREDLQSAKQPQDMKEHDGA